ncbi:phage tail assembly chaperone [Hydrogenophaga sp.]|uniref:phage tail assembly chaperone n=1 Tax=Hydrogenophaga sp. TaxID=1904254 RepID=UPI003D101B6A
MAFKMAQQPTFKVKVTVPVPNNRGGVDKNTFVAVFKRTSTDELADLGERRLNDADLVRDRIVDWELVDADTNAPIPFTAENLEALLQIQPTPKFTALAFYENAYGGKP